MLPLYPFQKDGRRALRAHPRFILADEMGLGKTVQVLAALRADFLPVVVICPASVRLVWADEVAKWRPELSVDVITHGKQKATGADITVTSYELFGKVKTPKPNTVVCDEAHYLQNKDSQRTRRISTAVGAASGSDAMRVWLLTGTPLWSRPRSLYPLLYITGAYLKPYHGYATQFCDAGQKYIPGVGYAWDDSGASNLDELAEVVAPFMLRRLKADVLKELPEKQRQVIKTNTGLSHAEKDVKDFDPASVAEGTIPPGPIATAIRETALLKVPAVVDHVKMVLTSERKVVLFAWNRDVMDDLAAALAPYGVARVDGNVTLPKRWAAVKAFQNNPRTRIFLGQTVAAGTGLTLTAANTVIFAQPDWTPANILQAEDRVHRISQTKKVLVQYLITRGSIEESMLSNVLSKMSIATAVLDNQGE